MRLFAIALLLLVPALTGLSAETIESTRRPPPGIPVPADVRAKLEADTAALGRDIEDAKQSLADKPDLIGLLPDVQIFYNAVHYALEDDIFYSTNDFKIATDFLKQGNERLKQLRAGQAPWNTATGLVVRGYVSKIDGSVQPYGLVVPTSYRPDSEHQHRLDFWFHGRGDKLSELSFIRDREKNVGEFAPADAFVLHPYGRFCNAYKFAGEVDVFEALENAEQHYPIDTNRISVRGFSMGGAATWHIAAHHAGLWAAVSPGAGFVDVAIYQKLTEKNTQPAWYEPKLWHLYNAVDYAGNLFNCGVVAYSGEIDPQKQAADLMSNAMTAEGLTLTHVIGPNTAHKYEPTAKKRVTALVDAIADKGRDPWPHEIKFTTWTLRYNQMDWVTIDGLEKHWERARIHCRVSSNNWTIFVDTTNVTAFTITVPPYMPQLMKNNFPKIVLNGETNIFGVFNPGSDRFQYIKTSKGWVRSKTPLNSNELHKVHGLQGPIDDAFMDSFIFVRPTRKPLNPQIDAWAKENLEQAIAQWRLQFRGEPRVKNDVDITAEDIVSNNLILWGDPDSNRVFEKIAKKLPIQWDAKQITLGTSNYPSGHFAPVFIYPNPLSPGRYIVVNSSFTFSEVAHLSNAVQTPKLPDYAVVDINVPLAERATKGVAIAGFFDEQWKLPANSTK